MGTRRIIPGIFQRDDLDVKRLSVGATVLYSVFLGLSIVLFGFSRFCMVAQF